MPWPTSPWVPSTGLAISVTRCFFKNYFSWLHCHIGQVQTDLLSSCSVKTVNLKKLPRWSRCHITNVLSKFCYCLQVMILLWWKVGWIVKTDDDTVNDMWQLQETLEDMEENSERYIFASFCWSPLKTATYCCPSKPTPHVHTGMKLVASTRPTMSFVHPQDSALRNG